jgi:hypothetical protein
MKVFVLVSTMFLTVGVLAFAAADEPAKKAPQDPLARFEPRSTPGAGQAYLKRYAGDWTIAKTFFPRTGEPTRSKGTCKQAMVQDGRFLQSDFTLESGGKTSTGVGVIGFEPENGLFTSFWYDSRQTRMSVRQSKERFDGKQIVLFSKSLEADGREARKSKTVSTISEDGNTIIHKQFSLGAGGEERLLMELVFSRVASK